MSSREITASWDRLFSESREVADTRLRDAIRATKELPEGVDRTAVIVAHMHTGQAEFFASAIGVAAQKVAESLDDLARAVTEVGDLA